MARFTIRSLAVSAIALLSCSGSNAAAIHDRELVREAHGHTFGKRLSGYTSVVVFGASYQDNAHPRDSQYSGSLKPAPYYQGRWSNGIVMSEYLAKKLSASIFDYAYGGAQVDNNLTYGSVPSSADQVQTYLSDVKSGKIVRGTGRVLHVTWVGINSITQIWNDWQKDGNVTKANARVNQNAVAVLNQVKLLQANAPVAAGVSAADFLIIPIPPLEIVPTFGYQTTPNFDSKQLQALGNFAAAYNSVLVNGVKNISKTDTTKRKTLTYDLVTRWRAMINDPATYKFTDVKNPCLNSSTGGVCSKPSAFFYWDTLHPTTAAHSSIANGILSQLQKAT